MEILEKFKVKIEKILLIATTGILIANSSIAIETNKVKEPSAVRDNLLLTESDYIYIPEGLGSSLEELPTRFSLADKLDIRVESQGITNECWAFSTIKSLETNIAIKENSRTLSDFSERHMSYATSKLFLDGVNENGFDKNVGDGGLLVEGLAYLTNGQGAVVEEYMPFENNEVLISLDSINKPVDTVVNDYYIFPIINKKYTYDNSGNTISVKYLKADGTEYTSSELNSVRKIIKEHIMQNGSIATTTIGLQKDFYNGSTIFNSTAYNCNSENYERDHAFSIIGWDDNYSKDNFAEGHKPSTDGAYIVLNSYGKRAFDEGILYVSYEDKNIESESYGIQSATKKDYDSIYQKDFYGGIFQIGARNINVGYYGVVFDRDVSKKEILDSIGVTLCSYCNIEVYINPVNSDMDINKMKKVANLTEEMNPGYHRIYIEPTTLEGNQFAIAIKQITNNESFYMEIEAPEDGTSYAYVDSDNKSYVSLNGNDWENLKDLNVSGIDMSKADACIKAFTDEEKEEIVEPEPDTHEDEENGEIINSEPDIHEDEGNGEIINSEPDTYEDEINEEIIEINSNTYKIKEDYIYNIRYGTNVEEFKNSINTNSQSLEIIHNGEIISTGRIITGMKLRLSDGKEYTIIVRGDTNSDGKITITDLSKIILHYNDTEGFILSGDALKAADMNFDGRVSIVDISQMLILYNSL